LEITILIELKEGKLYGQTLSNIIEIKHTKSLIIQLQVSPPFNWIMTNSIFLGEDKDSKSAKDYKN